MAKRQHNGDIGNLFADVPASLPDELFETLLQQPGCRLERIVSHGHCTPEGQWYDQAWDEWVLLVKGEATLAIEGRNKHIQLKPGDYLLLPAHQRHRVVCTAAGTDTIWLALHFNQDI